MIKRLSEKIADKMNCEGTIQSEDIAAYSYSIEITLATIINFISIAVIAILFGRFAEMIMFVIGFVPLRMLKGGYHADTHLGCILILIVCATLLMLLIKFELWFYSIPILIAATIYLFISQGKNSNQLITEKKQKKFDMTARVIIALYAIFCVIVALIWGFTPIIFALLYGVGIAGISLFVSKHIRKQITE